MLSELQTNVCVPNHLSGTRAEQRTDRRDERGGVSKKRQETVRDGDGGVETFTASSLSIHGS